MKIRFIISNIILPLIVIFTSIICYADETDENPLPVDQAFMLTVSLPEQNKILLYWTITPSYHLYRDSFKISFSPNIASNINFPQGELKYDEVRGRYEAFVGSLILPISFHSSFNTLKMQVDYQGCSENGFCYPPVSKYFDLNLKNLSVSPTSAPQTTSIPAQQNLHSLLNSQDSIVHLLQTQHISILLLIFLVLGLLLAMTPCVLPMVPILTGIIAGSREANNTRSAFYLSLSYVLGTAITYSAAGMIAALLGSSLQVALQQPWLIATTSLLFFILALSLFGFFELRLPQGIHQRLILFSNYQKGGSLLGVFIMGIISALIVSPCVTAPLVGVLMYIAQTGNAWLGASALFIMAIGMGIPLLFIGTSAGRWLPKSGPWMAGIKLLFGFMMVAMAIWMLSRIMPLWVITFLWASLFFIFAIALLFYLPHFLEKKAINRFLAIIASFSGMFFMVDLVKIPLLYNKPELLALTHPTNKVITIHNMAEFQATLAEAKQNKQPIFLDFYADWCTSCIIMEKTVFNQPDIKAVMSKYTIIKVDLTANTLESHQLMKKFNVIAPPTYIFLDDHAYEIPKSRIIGELSASDFLKKISASYQTYCHQKKLHEEKASMSC